MIEPHSPHSLKDHILEKIQQGETSMKPRWHFILKSLLLMVGIVGVFLFLLYVASFVLFVLHESGVWFLPIFGSKGIIELLVSIPWLLVLVGFIFFICLEVLVRQYAFAYKRSLIFSLCIIFLLVLLGNIVISKIGIHQLLFTRATLHELPVMEPLYRGYGMKHLKQVRTGQIKIFTDHGFVIKSKHAEDILINIVRETRLPFGSTFMIGDVVVVFGEEHNGVINALGIRKINKHPLLVMPIETSR